MSTTFCEKSASESIQHTLTSKEKEGLTAKDFYEVSDACSKLYIGGTSDRCSDNRLLSFLIY